MTYTYSEDLKPTPAAAREEPVFTPVYARTRSSRAKPVKTWMILAPIGVLVLGGAAAAMLMNPAEETAPLAEPAPTMISAPAPAVPVEAEPLVIENAVVEQPAPAPVTRQAAPARRAAPAARTTPRVETPAPSAPAAQSATSDLNTATPIPATPPAPIVVAPTPTTTPPPVVVITPEG